jgi:hypothetical protein
MRSVKAQKLFCLGIMENFISVLNHSGCFCEIQQVTLLKINKQQAGIGFNFQ